jgi:hypothetical protein
LHGITNGYQHLTFLSLMNHILFPVIVSLAASGLALAATKMKPRSGEEPYVGQYTLDQGGTDAAGGVHLMLFPGGDYAIVYFGGMQQGTWKALPNGELELHEWAADPADFLVYGRHTSTLGNDVRLQFERFEESYAKIGLTETDQGRTALHPAFNADANCYGNSYYIKRPAGVLTALRLAAYQEAAQAQYEQVQFSKKLLYTFPLERRYNDYQVVYSAAASKPAAAYVGRFVSKELTLYPAATAHLRGVPGDSYGERDDISATDLKGIKPYIKAARQSMPTKLTIRNKPDDVVLTYQQVAGTTQPLEESTITLLDPLFIARCE